MYIKLYIKICIIVTGKKEKIINLLIQHDVINTIK